MFVPLWGLQARSPVQTPYPMSKSSLSFSLVATVAHQKLSPMWLLLTSVHPLYCFPLYQNGITHGKFACSCFLSFDSSLNHAGSVLHAKLDVKIILVNQCYCTKFLGHPLNDYVEQKQIPLIHSFTSPVVRLSRMSKIAHVIIPVVLSYSPLRCWLLWFIIRYPLVWLSPFISVKNIGTLLLRDCLRSTHAKLSVEFPVQFQSPSSSAIGSVLQIFSNSSTLGARAL